MQIPLKIKKLEFLNRYVLLAYVLLAGSILFLLNPGLYWDDWVWIFKNREEVLAIGRELGIWWGGYVTNFINSQDHPAALMRLVAWISWIAGSFFFAMALHAKKLVSKDDAFLVFLMCSATYAASIRYFISASFYNVYIASFWFGVFILARYKKSTKNQIIAAPFLFFSFYLNSLIAVYGLIVFVLFLIGFRQKYQINKSMTSIGDRIIGDEPIGLDIRSFRGFLKTLKLRLINIFKITINELLNLSLINRSLMVKILKSEIIDFLKKYYILLSIPIIFILTKKLSIEKSPAYESYNEIDLKVLFSSIFISIKMLPKLLFEYILFASRTAKSSFIIINFMIIFIIMRKVKRVANIESGWRSFGIPMIVGAVLLSTSIYPYLVVHKIPKVSDYYESRHLLPAILAISLFYIGLINLLSSQIFTKNHKTQNLFKNILLSYFLALNIGAAQINGIRLWQDWEIQVGIMSYIKENIAEFSRVNTFLINDRTNDSRIGNRHVWNYEYTGNLISVFDSRDRLGVALNEYIGWEKNVVLLNSDFYKRRYNIADYNFNGPHALIFIFNKELSYQKFNTLKFAYEYIFGKPYVGTINEKYLFEHEYEYIEVPKIAPLLFEIRDALAAYKLKYGFYPSDIRGLPGVPLNGIEAPKDSYVNYIPGLFPEFMAIPDAFNSRRESGSAAIKDRPYYAYISNGLDYKLTYSKALDFAYAKQAYPGLIDSKANGYGIWTKGAINW